ncbi:hypothetical protein FOZ63_023998, partial [Perkinsus olseni]
KGMKERKHLVEAELQQAESRIKTTDNLVEGRLVSSTDRVEKEVRSTRLCYHTPMCFC